MVTVVRARARHGGCRRDDDSVSTFSIAHASRPARRRRRRDGAQIASSTSVPEPVCSRPRSPNARRRCSPSSSTASLAQRLARRFAATPNVIVVHADVGEVPLPCTPYRVVANPPFGRTAAILHRSARRSGRRLGARRPRRPVAGRPPPRPRSRGTAARSPGRDLGAVVALRQGSPASGRVVQPPPVGRRRGTGDRPAGAPTRPGPRTSSGTRPSCGTGFATRPDAPRVGVGEWLTRLPGLSSACTLRPRCQHGLALGYPEC